MSKENKKENGICDKNLVFKIITLGDSGVGKTSIINRYTNDNFNDTNISTIGITCANKEIYFNFL